MRTEGLSAQTSARVIIFATGVHVPDCLASRDKLKQIMTQTSPSDSTLVIPVILSGGVGSRLWPLSRELYPKQLHALVTEKSLLQETALRVSGDRFGEPAIICNNENRFLVAEHLRDCGVNPSAIMLEPVGRNTAPAAAIAALLIAETDEDALILLLPSDHIIKNQDEFLRVIDRAIAAAQTGYLVTFGIPATAPETGYGYIESGSKIASAPGCFQVAQFIEKPDAATAEAYVAAGNYAWNSGMFLFSAATFLSELEIHNPEVLALCRATLETRQTDMDFMRLGQDSFTQIKGISIDYAVMEHTDKAAVVPAEMGWSDVGAWDTLWDISNKDDDGNVLKGNVITENVRNSYIRTDKQWVAAAGLEDTIVVSTDDAVLVAGKGNAQQVKELVAQLKVSAPELQLSHSLVHRPWGWYQSLGVGPAFQVKLIQLNPGARISLQRHRHRAEHWVVVSGNATVTCDEDVFEMEKNQSTFIPVKAIHRLENKSSQPLQIIEVQSGDYLGEDDIERFDDQYGRN